jgi:hypothetical protein
MTKHPEPTATIGQPRRVPAATLLNTTGRVATTALLAATDPKTPPFRGD